MIASVSITAIIAITAITAITVIVAIAVIVIIDDVCRQYHYHYGDENDGWVAAFLGMLRGASGFKSLSVASLVRKGHKAGNVAISFCAFKVGFRPKLKQRWGVWY